MKRSHSQRYPRVITPAVRASIEGAAAIRKALQKPTKQPVEIRKAMKSPTQPGEVLVSMLRPECRPSDKPAVRGVTAYLSIYNSVKGESGLIYGRLHDERGAHCAIGSFFHSTHNDTSLPTELIDEVATVNDSCASFTPKQRRKAVLQWLRWKLEQLGYRMAGRKPSAAQS